METTDDKEVESIKEKDDNKIAETAKDKDVTEIAENLKDKDVTEVSEGTKDKDVNGVAENVKEKDVTEVSEGTKDKDVNGVAEGIKETDVDVASDTQSDDEFDLEDGLLYDYHKLEEKQSSQVPKCWSCLQITFFALSTLFSITAFTFISDLIIFFDFNCVFYANKIVFKNVTEDELQRNAINVKKRNIFMRADELAIDFINSDFPPASRCFISFFPIISIICSITWLVLFVMFRHLRHQWLIVIPALVFAVIFSVISYVFQGQVMKGATHFGRLLVNASIEANLVNNPEVKELTNFMGICEFSMLMSALLWTFGAILLIVRMLMTADFNYIRVQVQLVELNPEDMPFLSDYVEFDPPPPPTDTTETTRCKKRMISILRPPDKGSLRIKNMIEVEGAGTAKGETVAPSSRVIVNPMVVTADVETRKQSKKVTMQMSPYDKVSSTSKDINAPSTSKDNKLPVITDSPAKQKPSTAKINVIDDEIVPASDDDTIPSNDQITRNSQLSEDRTQVSSESTPSISDQTTLSSALSLPRDDRTQASSEFSIPSADRSKISSELSLSTDDSTLTGSESSVRQDDRSK